MMIHYRNNFTAATKREAFQRAAGVCECHLIPHVFDVACGRPLGNGNTFYEHINPDAICGRNDLDNCAVLTKTCWKIKTATHDLPVIAKSNRVRDRAWGIKKPRSITAWRRFDQTIRYASRER